jgi:TrmH family RNA methyltransferase
VPTRSRSVHNAQVVRLAKLVERRRMRELEGAFVVDGPVLLVEALDVGRSLEAVFVDRDRRSVGIDALLERAEGAGADVFEVEGSVLRRATDPVHPQPVATVVRHEAPSPTTLADARTVVVLASVADPGNGGTLVRAALAAGLDAVAVTDGTVDVFSPKAVRASAGAILRLPVVPLGATATAAEPLRSAGLTVLATRATGGAAPDEVDLTARCALVLGNEAHGVDPALQAGADAALTIPMAGPAESLNVAMAGAVLCFEVLRQRRQSATGESFGRTPAPDGRV